MAIRCAACDHENTDAAKECQGCGASLTLPCGQCGQLLPADARFCLQCGAPAQRSARPAPAVADGERRHLTVLFCDLVGSTALAERLDPEDWRDVVVRFQQEAIGVIEQAGGYVAQHLGDGLLVYFGYPRASEDDAELAIRCGLTLVHATRALNPELMSLYGVELDLRVGLHTGPVVVGEVGGTRRETLALGSAANVAARVQGEAEPGTVMATTSTLRRVEQLFEVRDMGLRSLKGIEQPVRLYTVQQPSGTRDRFEFAGQTLTPFVGRTEELDALRACFTEAAAGRGQAVTILGEAGMGKSRLTHAFRRSLEQSGIRWHECRAAAYNRDSPLQPWIQLQRELLGIRGTEPDVDKIGRLEVSLEAAGMNLSEAVPLFASLHGMTLKPPYSLPALSPLGLRKRTLDLLADWLLQLARDRKPVVLLVEDLHWLDPSSVELIALLLERVNDSHLLILLTQRPDFESPWPTTSTTLALERLAPSELERLVVNAVSEGSLAEEWVETIIDRSDGVPLFAEELARSVASSEVIPDAPASEISIPETLEDSLMARLEQMDDVKRIAQLSSVVGRECPARLLDGLWQGDPRDLREGLRSAERAGVLVRMDGEQGPIYLFRHSLIRDAAYNSMLRKTRRRHHQAVEQTLKERFPATTEEQPELLAHHLTEARDEDAAIEAWTDAGVLALGRAAYEEAIRHLRQARTLLSKRADEARELDVVQLLAGALLVERGWAHDETREAWEAAADLCDAKEEPLRAGAIACGLGDVYSSLDLEKSLHHYEAMIEWGLRDDLPLLVIAGHQGAAIPLRYLGRFGEARAHLDAGLAIYDPEQHRFVDAGFHEEKGISLLAWSAWLHWDMGAVDRAREDARRGLELAEALGNPFALAFITTWGAAVEVFSRNWPRAIELGRRAARVSADHGFVMLEAMGHIADFVGRAREEGLDGAADLCRLELGRMAATGNTLGGAEIIAIIGDLELAQGQPSQALATAELGLGLSAGLGQPWCNAWLLTLKGNALLAGAGEDPMTASMMGEDLFRSAVEIARTQGAHSNELRAATSLASLLRDDGRGSEATELLRAALANFDPDLDSVELRQARELMESVT
jgi:class 3 adenylate cyclase/tetratricopeptide (TPR) repeat protein